MPRLTLTMDTTQLDAKAKATEQAVAKVGDAAVETGRKIDQSTRQSAGGLGQLATVQSKYGSAIAESLRTAQQAAQQLTQQQAALGTATQSVQAEMLRLRDAAKSWADVQRTGADQVSGVLAQLEAEFARTQADLKERVARGLLSPQEAQALGQQAGRAYNTGLLHEIERLGTAGALSGATGEARYLGLANSLKQVDTVATRTASSGLRTLNTSLATIVATEIGVRSGLGSFIGTIGSLSLGTLTSIGVIGGMAAIGFGIQEIKRRADEARKPVEDLLARAKELADKQRDPLLGVTQDRAAAQAGVEETNAHVAQLKKLLAGVGESDRADPFRKQLADAERQLRAFREAVEAFDAEERRLRQAEADDRKRQEDEAERRREQAHQRELARIKAEADAYFAFQAALATDVTPTVTNTAGQRFTAAPPPDSGPVQAYHDAVDRFNKAGLQVVDTTKQLALKLAELKDAHEREVAATRRATDATLATQAAAFDAADAMVQLIEHLTGLPPVAVAAVASIESIIKAATRKTVDQATGAVVSSPNPLGIAVAGVGLVGSILGGIFGGGARRREEERRRAEAAASTQERIRQFAGDLQQRTPLEGELYQLQERFRALAKEARQTGADIRSAQEAYQAERERLRAEAAQKEQDARDELQVRALAAQGRTQEADQLRRAIAQQAELRDAEKQGYDQVTIAMLHQVQALEAEAAARERAIQEQDRSTSLQVRHFQALGQNRAADDLARQLQHEQELRLAVAEGISGYNRALLEQVQALEDAAVAEERRRQDAQATEDLEVRRLRALGLGGQADDLAFQLQQQRELEDARRRGLPPQAIAQLEDVLKLEARARQQSTSGPTTSTSGTTNFAVKDITGITETTGVRLDGRLATMNVILRQIELNTRARAPGSVIVQGGGSVDPATVFRSVDRLGSRDLSILNSGAGVAPTT